MKTIAYTTLIAILGASGCLVDDNQPAPLQSWPVIGNGFVAEADGATLLAEYPGSSGVMFISPKVYGCDARVQFEVLPLNPESVLVVMMGASAPGTSPKINLPEDYDGSIGHLLAKTDAYFFAFHNAAHKRTPFVRKHPFARGESSDIAAVPDNVMTTQWHNIEVVHSCDGELSLIIDGKTMIDAKDDDPLAGGQIVLRLRGTKTHTASAMFRNFTVTQP